MNEEARIKELAYQAMLAYCGDYWEEVIRMLSEEERHEYYLLVTQSCIFMKDENDSCYCSTVDCEDKTETRCPNVICEYCEELKND